MWGGGRDLEDKSTRREIIESSLASIWGRQKLAAKISAGLLIHLTLFLFLEPIVRQN